MSSGEEYSLPSEERVSEKTLLTVTWIVTGIPALFLIARLVIRIKSFSKLLLDDYLVIAAWLMLLASAIMWQVKGSALYWMYDLQYGRRQPSPDFLPTYSAFMPLVAVWHILFYTCLWTVKFSFLVFFRTLGFKVRQNKIWWWVVFIVTLCGWIVLIGDIDYGCTLSDITYIMSDCPKKKHVKFQDITFYINMAVDVLTDVLILTIPFRILWNVRIPLHKKALLLGVFSLTIVIMAVSIIRVTLVKRVGNHAGEQIASIEWICLWSYVEAGAAITVACTASFRQLFVFTKKLQNQKAAGSRPWRFLERLVYRRQTPRAGMNKQSSHQFNQTPGNPADNGYEHYIASLGPVHVRRSFDVATAMPTAGGQAKVVSPHAGYEQV